MWFSPGSEEQTIDKDGGLFTQSRNLQCEIDKCYENMCEIIFEEMDKNVDYINQIKRSRKRFKNTKPYWTEQLTCFWRDMNAAEKLYLKCKQNNRRRFELRQEFIQSRNKFDKMLRRQEREYNKNRIDQIEQANSSDPKQFWKYLKGLGSKKTSYIPMKIYDVNGYIKSDTHSVLEKWKYDFQKLYSSGIQDTASIEFDDALYDFVLAENSRFDEHNMMNERFTNITPLNYPITELEVHRVVQKLKNKKATGYDRIPNEVLKRDSIIRVLCSLFNLCFDKSRIPSSWKRAIILPIPKSSMKDPCVPINYRGISLLSCVSKTYTAVLNARLTQYLESNELITDYQNGFRRGRSCTDHIFVLSNIIRTRISEKLSTFCCFIDFKKAFDSIDRNLLMYKMATLYNVKCITEMFRNTSACVRVNDLYIQSGLILLQECDREITSLQLYFVCI
jgi:hypothetical protein